MDSSKVMGLLDQLDDEVDDLEDALAPLIKTALSETSSKLPLLDKAKLYVLVTYAIESILFSYLRLNGVKAREHPVFVELTRVKQYFEKIKRVENPPERTLVVDKQAVGRFIKAGLAGNEKYDLQRAEREAKERAKAHIRFEEISKSADKRKAEEEPVTNEQAGSSDSDSSSEDIIGGLEEPTPISAPVADVPPPKKKRKTVSSGSVSTSGASTPSSSGSSNSKNTKLKEGKREGKKAKKAEKKKLPKE